MFAMKINVRSIAGMSRKGKIVLTLMGVVLCAEAAMAYQVSGYAANPCKIEAAGKFISTGGGCKDLVTGRVWSRNTTSPERGASFWTFSGATGYCSNLVEGGYTDWRMPTRDEMKAVSAHGAGTYLDVYKYVTGDTGQVLEADFAKWSSTTVKGGKYAYAISLGSGSESSTWATNGGSWTDLVCTR